MAKSTVIDRDLISYFRCPEMYGKCRIEDSASSYIGDLAGDALRFLHTSRRSSSEYIPGGIESDASQEPDQTCVPSPFLPGEIAQHLRFERYVETRSQVGWRACWEEWQRRAYYTIRPVLGVSIRRHLQRRALRGWNEIRFPTWPVDRTVDNVLEQFLERSMKAHGVDRIPFIWFWPEGHKSCCMMTHDVEEAAGVRACDALMDLDSRAGLAASFQFVPEGRYRVTGELLDRVRGRGFEVNVHDLNHDGHLYRSREEFLRRAEKINRYVAEYDAKGFRSAVLYRNLAWYDAFRFAYDMSVPNVAHLDPQRGGCCTITPYFIGNIVELPLTTIQDYSLFNILGDYSTGLWEIQTEYLVKKHGLLSFNIHPDYLVNERARSTYTALLRHLAWLRSEGHTYFARPGEVERWWRERDKMCLVYEDARWRIEGSGSERAVVAYAHAAQDGLKYSFDR
jgi:hypothetical protein